MPDTFKHTAIAASAGSGKTFQLAHRYIGLLASGVLPEKIVALTFSRKAAGEIFDSIVSYLCKAACSKENALLTAERINCPDLRQKNFLLLLKKLIQSLPRLQIGTLDGFAVGVAKAFPFELGIPRNFELLDNDGAEAACARQTVLRRLFNRRLIDSKTRDAFFAAFKMATFGAEEKKLIETLNTFIREYHDTFLLCPSAHCWGMSERIWPQGSEWLRDPPDLDAAASALESLVDKTLTGNILTRWQTFISAARAFSPAIPLDKKQLYLFEKLLPIASDLLQGTAEIKINRTALSLDREIGLLAHTLVRHIMHKEIETNLTRSRGIYRLLHHYEQSYDSFVRRKGKLTFDDVQYLLSPGNPLNQDTVLSSEAGDNRLYIDFRLDAKLDHWLLDEFQDTSDLQWMVLANLIDEVVQDQSGRRSFFYVGDVKQAIYGWRKGNARLFGEILRQYEGLITEKPLDRSFRSSQPVIDTINSIFEKLPSDLPKAAGSEWRKIWRKHECAEGIVPENGFAAILEPPCDDGVKPDASDRYTILAKLLSEIDPIPKKISVAVLVRSNAQGRDIVNFLRKECPEFSVCHEGQAEIRDNPVVGLLLSLVQVAAHPGDSFAARHLMMSPLDAVIRKECHTYEPLPLILLTEIMESGFQSFFRSWGEKLDAAAALDAFGQKRLADLITAAGEFDATGSRSCNDLILFLKNYKIKDAPAENTIRVMTIHQSKGLGFDMVVLPEMQNRSMITGRVGEFEIFRHAEKNSAGVLKMPRKPFAAGDPVLAAKIEERAAMNCFEELCTLYVALTRAKQGLYIISSFQGKTSKSLTQAAFVKLQLTGELQPDSDRSIQLAGEKITALYEWGNPDWHQKVSVSLPEEKKPHP
ncbi:MAG: UvrD-helicase domain-containing protein, partial [Desulfobulbaceae bacterium]|nr:UvrD-helicase domain-containing protein [Desulfobulbaceae bacterium]